MKCRNRAAVFLAGMALATCVLVHDGIAQTPQGAPAAPPTGSPIQRILPATPPNVSTGLPGPGQEPLQNLAPNIARRVTQVSVEGATIVDASETSAITKDLVGPAISTRAIEDARLELVRRYRDTGYPLVTVSASLAADGRLRYTVIEGRIADVKLDGDIGPAGTKVLDFLRNLVRPGPVNAEELERWLLLAQDVPGVSLQTVLRPSESEPGVLTLVARVSRETFSGLVAADNRAYRYTGPDQVLALIGANSFTSLGERTELSMFKSPINNSQIFGQGSFEAFLGNSGLKVRLYGGAGSTLPTGTLRTSGYEGRTIVAGVQVSYPLIYTRQQKLNLVGLFDFIQSNIYLQGNLSTKDSLRIFRVGVDYALQDMLLGNERPAVNQITARLSQGIDGLGSSPTKALSAGRVGSAVDFTKLSAELSRNQTLFSPFKDASVSLLAVVAGQATTNILPSPEKFYLGGMRFTRGFYAGEVTGDNALAATAELQLNTGVQGEVWGKSVDVGMQFYGFYDWGQSYENKTLDKGRRISSVGIGLRSTFNRVIEIDLEGVSRLTRYPQTSNSGIKGLGAQAFYWRVLGRF